MRIKVIIPNTSKDFLEKSVEGFREIENKLRDNNLCVEFYVTCLHEGPASLETAYDEGLAIPGLVDEVIKAKEEGFDAITVDCAADPGAQLLREISELPIVFAGEASYYYAMNVSRRFSLITVVENTKALNEININKYCIQHRVASVKSSNIPVLDVQDERKSYNAILAKAKQAIEQDGAQAIVLGCTGMSEIVPKLQKELGIPVIDPRRASISMAISLVSMNLSQSKLAFMSQPVK